MKPILSICISTYNRRETLRETLDSIIPQVNGNRDIEILVSDNASDDGTKYLIADYMSHYSCIRYNRNPENLGFDGNVIACVEQAKGEYISFFSDDDIALPGTFDKILDVIRLHAPIIIYLNHYAFVQNPIEVIRYPGLPTKDIHFTNGKEFFCFCTGGFISALTIKSSYAKKYTPCIKNNGLGYAHMNYTARISLQETGLFSFIGSLCIAARRSYKPESPDYDWLTSCAINQGIFLTELKDEGLLDHKTLTIMMNHIIMKVLPRLILVKKCLGNYKHLDSQKKIITDIFHTYPLFFFFSYPFLILPVWFLKPPYMAVRFIIQLTRKFWINCIFMNRQTKLIHQESNK